MLESHRYGKLQEEKAKSGHSKIVERFQRRAIIEKVLAQERQKLELQEKCKRFLGLKKLRETARLSNVSPARSKTDPKSVQAKYPIAKQQLEEEKVRTARKLALSRIKQRNKGKQQSTTKQETDVAKISESDVEKISESDVEKISESEVLPESISQNQTVIHDKLPLDNNGVAESSSVEASDHVTQQILLQPIVEESPSSEYNHLPELMPDIIVTPVCSSAPDVFGMHQTISTQSPSSPHQLVVPSLLQAEHCPEMFAEMKRREQEMCQISEDRSSPNIQPESPHQLDSEFTANPQLEQGTHYVAQDVHNISQETHNIAQETQLHVDQYPLHNTIAETLVLLQDNSPVGNGTEAIVNNVHQQCEELLTIQQPENTCATAQQDATTGDATDQVFEGRQGSSKLENGLNNVSNEGDEEVSS